MAGINTSLKIVRPKAVTNRKGEESSIGKQKQANLKEFGFATRPVAVVKTTAVASQYMAASPPEKRRRIQRKSPPPCVGEIEETQFAYLTQSPDEDLDLDEDADGGGGGGSATLAPRFLGRGGLQKLGRHDKNLCMKTESEIVDEKYNLGPTKVEQEEWIEKLEFWIKLEGKVKLDMAMKGEVGEEEEGKVMPQPPITPRRNRRLPVEIPNSQSPLSSPLKTQSTQTPSRSQRMNSPTADRGPANRDKAGRMDETSWHSRRTVIKSSQWWENEDTHNNFSETDDETEDEVGRVILNNNPSVKELLGVVKTVTDPIEEPQLPVLEAEQQSHTKILVSRSPIQDKSAIFTPRPSQTIPVDLESSPLSSLCTTPVLMQSQSQLEVSCNDPGASIIDQRPSLQVAATNCSFSENDSSPLTSLCTTPQNSESLSSSFVTEIPKTHLNDLHSRFQSGIQNDDQPDSATNKLTDQDELSLGDFLDPAESPEEEEAPMMDFKPVRTQQFPHSFFVKDVIPSWPPPSSPTASFPGSLGPPTNMSQSVGDLILENEVELEVDGSQGDEKEDHTQSILPDAPLEMSSSAAANIDNDIESSNEKYRTDEVDDKEIPSPSEPALLPGLKAITTSQLLPDTLMASFPMPPSLFTQLSGNYYDYDETQ